MCLCDMYTCMQVPKEARKERQILQNADTDSWESPDIGARNLT